MRNVVAIAGVALLAAGCAGRMQPVGPTDLPPRDSTAVPARTSADTDIVVQPPAPAVQPRELDPLPLPSGVATNDFDIALEYNRRVEYWLEYFQRYHDTFALWLERMSRYEPLIRRELTGAGLPGDLVYLALIESGFLPSAISSARAVGIWQFMEGTARMEGLEVSTYIDERRDPVRATQAAVHHLGGLYRELGSWYLVAAAYNSGSGRVTRALDAEAGGARGADSLFWRIVPVLPAETRDYVPKLLAASILAKYPERFGIAPRALPGPDDVAVVHIGRATDLAAIARAARTDESVIRRLNPEFYLGVTPPGRRVAVRVPAGRARGLLARLDDMPRRERVHDLRYVADAGDTPTEIARRYGVSLAALRKANHLKKKTRVLAEGRQLRIPLGAPAPALLAQGEEKTKSTGKLASAEHKAPAAATARAAESGSADAPARTRVSAQDSDATSRDDASARPKARASVADADTDASARPKARTSVADADTDAPARPKARPSGADADSDAPAHPKARASRADAEAAAPARTKVRTAQRDADTYVVRPGDTLANIADAHDLTLPQLRELNGLSRVSVIQPGQKLRLATRVAEAGDGAAPARAHARARKDPETGSADAPTRARASARDDVVRSADAPTRTRASARDHLLRSADASARAQASARSEEKTGSDAPARTHAAARVAHSEEGAPARRAVARGERAADSYVVRPGDTLADIADAHGLTLERLRELNGLTRANVIHPGDTLRLSRARVVVYRVHQGDTLYRIARKHGVTVEELRDWNHLAPDAVIQPGDEVDVRIQGASER